MPEVLEALGHAYEEAGDLEKAEAAYLKLVEREPENENFHGLLNAVQQKLGREIKPVDFSSKEMALVGGGACPASRRPSDAKQEAMVKEALENSDLFSRYNLTEKAIAELEKVLQIYPDQIDVHRRILEISRKGFPERAAAAAAQLARIFTEQGDSRDGKQIPSHRVGQGRLARDSAASAAPAKKAEELRRHRPPAPERSPCQAARRNSRFARSLQRRKSPLQRRPKLRHRQKLPLTSTPPEAQSEPPAFPPPLAAAPTLGRDDDGIDLSGDLEAMTAFGFEAPPAALLATGSASVDLPAPGGAWRSVPSYPRPSLVEAPPADGPAEIPLAAIPEETPADVRRGSLLSWPPEEAVGRPVEAPSAPKNRSSSPVGSSQLVAEEACASFSWKFRSLPEEPAAVSEEPPPSLKKRQPRASSRRGPPAVAEMPAPGPVEAFFEPVETAGPGEDPVGTLRPSLRNLPRGTPQAAKNRPLRNNRNAAREVEIEASGAAAAEEEEEEIPVELEDSRIEVEFYLENGFIG